MKQIESAAGFCLSGLAFFGAGFTFSQPGTLSLLKSAPRSYPFRGAFQSPAVLLWSLPAALPLGGSA